MYEGQLICKDLIEENWLEYLAYVKKCTEEDDERLKKRQELLGEAGIEPSYNNTIQEAKLATVGSLGRRYYDTSLNGFWNWYIAFKI